MKNDGGYGAAAQRHGGAAAAVGAHPTSGIVSDMSPIDANHADRLSRLVDQVSTIIVGKRRQIIDSVACLLAGGHLLIEDVPGVGKTTLAHALVGLARACASRACSSPPTCCRAT